MQRYAAGCNQGDYWSSWEMMQTQAVWLLNMQMSGVFFPESDIGGFYPTEHLTDELFIRWAFMGTFGPLMRSHGVNWRIRLPWGFGPENEARFVPLIRLRSAMFPYNYTLLSQANQKGVPMMRAMVLEFPEDLEARKLWDQFMWGPNILEAPVYEKGARERSVYLPEGSWVHYWTLQSFEGPSRVTVDAPLGRDPWFVRAGTVVPMREPSDTIPMESDDRLVLLVTPAGQEGPFTLYDDDRQTYRYEQGQSSRQTFRVSALSESGAFRREQISTHAQSIQGYFRNRSVPQLSHPYDLVCHRLQDRSGPIEDVELTTTSLCEASSRGESAQDAPCLSSGSAASRSRSCTTSE